MPFFSRHDHSRESSSSNSKSGRPPGELSHLKEVNQNKATLKKPEAAATKAKRGSIVITTRAPSPPPAVNVPGRFPSPVSPSATFLTEPDLDSTAATAGVSRHFSTGDRSSVIKKFQAGDEELDPSITKARERVLSAEAAEHEADRALERARSEVKEARAEVRRLTEEAREEARKLRIKTYYAKEVSKRGRALGREFALLCWCPGRLSFANLVAPQVMMSKLAKLLTLEDVRGWLIGCKSRQPIEERCCG